MLLFQLMGFSGWQGRELCPQADSMASSGTSTSTLASSVIEVESGRDDLALCQDEDDMTPLPPPPTLSITEESCSSLTRAVLDKAWQS